MNYLFKCGVVCVTNANSIHTNKVTGEAKYSDRKRCKMKLAACVNFFRVFVRMNNTFSHPFLSIKFLLNTSISISVYRIIPANREVDRENTFIIQLALEIIHFIEMHSVQSNVMKSIFGLMHMDYGYVCGIVPLALSLHRHTHPVISHCQSRRRTIVGIWGGKIKSMW